MTLTGLKFKKTLISLFGSQLAIAKPVISPVLRFFRHCHPAVLSATLYKAYDNLTYRYFKQTPVSPEVLQQKIAAYQAELLASTFAEEPVTISFCGATRRKGNPNNKLPQFLQSVIQHCDNSKQVEILLAIDPDDHLDYFIKLKKTYANQLRLRIVIAEKRLGYENLHRYDTLLFPYLAKNTRMICDYSDDCTVTANKFDKTLLQIDAQYPDNIYFIHTRDTQRETIIGDVAENLQLLYWSIQAKEPASYFPIFSKRVLDIAFEFARQQHALADWSPIANAWICDCYVDIISIYVKRLGHNRIHSFDMIAMNKTILANYQYPDAATGLTPNNRAFIKMLNNTTLDYMNSLAQTIATHVETPRETAFSK